MSTDYLTRYFDGFNNVVLNVNEGDCEEKAFEAKLTFKKNKMESLRVFLTELMKTHKDNETLPRKVTMKKIKDTFGNQLSTSTMRSVVMTMIETSVCAFSV
jgi:inhibitor of KinA sporulation pathway (predicted exonuclease)